MYFDKVTEEQSNGKFYVYAVDEKKGEAYLIDVSATIRTSSSSFNGQQLSIFCHPNEYFYRGKLDTKSDADRMSEQIGRLLSHVDWKNNSIHSPYNT